MEKLPILFIVLATSLIYSTASYGEWTKMSESLNDEDTYYVDFKKIKQQEGFVYWWQLSNYLKPTKSGILSAKSYIQGDCKNLWIKVLRSTSHTLPMAKGIGSDYIIPANWFQPPPKSSIEFILKSICNHVE